jgi:hypothetical protein
MTGETISVRLTKQPQKHLSELTKITKKTKNQREEYSKTNEEYIFSHRPPSLCVAELIIRNTVLRKIP